MTNKIIGVSAFTMGVVVGSLVTWKLLKTKYEQIAQAEIDSVKETFKRKTDEIENEEKNAPDENVDEMVAKARAQEATHKADISSYVKKVSDLEYTNYSKVSPEEEDEDEDEEEEGNEGTAEQPKPPVLDAPYVITPDEFGDVDGYDRITLTFYDDAVLADDDDRVIYDIGATVGVDSLSRFGEYEDDVVYVRNKRRKCDYEILLDHRAYSDVMNRYPHSY